MSVIMACKHPNCNHPGPFGFVDYGPWATYFYHHTNGRKECPGTFEFNGKHYLTQEDCWKEYKRIRGPFDPNWTAGWDARILEKNERKAKKFFKKWNDHHN